MVVQTRGLERDYVAVRGVIGKLLRAIFARLGYRLVHPEELAASQRALTAVGHVVRAHGAQTPTDDADGIRAIAFSRDRPLQLHALIESYLEAFDNAPLLRVLYSATSPRMRAAYQQLAREFSGDRAKGRVELHAESDFREDLLRELAAAGQERVFFLVDDIVFIRPVRAADLLRYPTESHVFSLRLSPAITYSYTTGRSETPPQLAETGDGRLREWDWAGGEIDWGYAFSVDGHVFAAAEVLALARQVQFRAPNSFEARMQLYAPYFAARRGVCYAEAALLNIPCNRVQREVANVHGQNAELQPERLLEYFESGTRVDVAALQNTGASACHVELDLPLRGDAQP